MELREIRELIAEIEEDIKNNKFKLTFRRYDTFFERIGMPYRRDFDVLRKLDRHFKRSGLSIWMGKELVKRLEDIEKGQTITFRMQDLTPVETDNTRESDVMSHNSSLKKATSHLQQEVIIFRHPPDPQLSEKDIPATTKNLIIAAPPKVEASATSVASSVFKRNSSGLDLKNLEDKLWKTADDLRANSKLNATEYSFPVLGVIFLRHAYRRFKDAKTEVEASLPVHSQRGRRPITKDDFQQAKAMFLPEKARWDYLANLPESVDIGEELDEAMRSIERDHESLAGVLPKNYSQFEKGLLHRLLRNFNDEALDKMPGDVFGRIYEYFLNKFAMTGAQEGGEFFTPPSLVNTIVNIIEPNHGIVLDPACGSFGMAVQTGHFLEENGLNPSEKVTFYGQEKSDTNTKLAKMNMTVHGLDCSILQGNTFYEDQHKLAGKCDFVMANPPFNVDGVDKNRDSVKNDPRLPFGLPKSDNANYLWIQYFYGYLNENGRSGFVMASSASDAGHSEKVIREQLVKTGAVDVMVSIGTKFFYTRSLPCTLWFFDRAKEKDPIRKNQTLMLDLRDVYRKVSSNLHDFTPEQLQNIKAIVCLYRGDNSYFQNTVSSYKSQTARALNSLVDLLAALKGKAAIAGDLHLDLSEVLDTLDIEHLKKQKRLLNNAVITWTAQIRELLKAEGIRKDRSVREKLLTVLSTIINLTGNWNEQADRAIYFHREELWLTNRFPKNKYADVQGLCKIVSQSDIKENDYSLTAGRYVGVSPQSDDEFDYEERMAEIKTQLQRLDEEAAELSVKIQNHLDELAL